MVGFGLFQLIPKQSTEEANATGITHTQIHCVKGNRTASNVVIVVLLRRVKRTMQPFAYHGGQNVPYLTCHIVPHNARPPFTPCSCLKGNMGHFGPRVKRGSSISLAVVPSPLISHFRIFILHPVALDTPLALLTCIPLYTAPCNPLSITTSLPSFVNVVLRRSDPLGIPAVFWCFLAKYKKRIDPLIDKDVEDQGNVDRLMVSRVYNISCAAVLAAGGTSDRVLAGYW